MTGSGLNVHVTGVILLVVGIIGFCASIVLWSAWGGCGVRAENAERPTNDVTAIDR